VYDRGAESELMGKLPLELKREKLKLLLMMRCKIMKLASWFFCEFYVARSKCRYRTLQSAPHAVVPPVLSNGQLIGYDRFDPIGAALRAGSCRRDHGVFPATSRGSGSVAMSLMQVISFKDTVLYKRGFWLSAAALVAAVAAPSVVDKSIFEQPVVHVIPIFILVGFWVYFLQKGRFFSIADEVIDCGDHLNVRRAGTEIEIPFSSISAAEVSTAYRMHRITVHLREETKIGRRVDFWPQASLWGNLFAVQQVAIGLADRAKRAIDSDV